MTLGLLSGCSYARQLQQLHEQHAFLYFCPGLTQSVFFSSAVSAMWCALSHSILCFLYSSIVCGVVGRRFACTLTEREWESSRLRASVSKQVSSPWPLSSTRLRARTVYVDNLCRPVVLLSVLFRSWWYVVAPCFDAEWCTCPQPAVFMILFG